MRNLLLLSVLILSASVQAEAAKRLSRGIAKATWATAKAVGKGSYQTAKFVVRHI